MKGIHMQIATRLTLFSLIFSFTLSTIHAEGPTIDSKKEIAALSKLIQAKVTEYKTIIKNHKVATTAIIAAVTIFMISIFRFNCKEPRKDCINRYSLSFKDLKLRSIEDVTGLQEQIRYILRNTHYIIEDGIIGRPGNSSAAIRVDPETGKVSAKEFCPSQGLYGWIHSYLKPISNTLKFPYEVGKVAATVGAGVYILAYPDALVTMIETAITQQKV